MQHKAPDLSDWHSEQSDGDLITAADMGAEAVKADVLSRPSSNNSQRSVGSFGTNKEDQITLVRSIHGNSRQISKQLTGPMRKASVGSNTSSRSRKGSILGGRRGSTRNILPDINDINEILKPLEGQADGTELQRFDWVIGYQPGRGQHNRCKGSKLLGVMDRHFTDATRISGDVLCGSQMTQRGSQIRHGSQMIHHGSQMGHLSDTQSSSLGDRRQDRDQRTELRSLQRSLLTSAQQTFEPEVWDGCGIEGEHLKRQQLAAVLGLSLNLSGKKEEHFDAEDENTILP